MRKRLLLLVAACRIVGAVPAFAQGDATAGANPGDIAPESAAPAVAAPPAPAPALLLPTIRPIRGTQGRTVNFEIREVWRDGFVGVPAEGGDAIFVEWIRVDLAWLAEWQKDIDHHRNRQPIYEGPLRGAAPSAPAPPLPSNGVILDVETERSSALDTRWADSEGSFDRDAYEMRRMAVSLRRMAQGNPTVRVEWYFIARNINSRAPWIFDAGARDVTLESGRTERFIVESAQVRSTELRLRDPDTQDYRSRRGHNLSGYAVLVWSGDTLIATRGNTPGTVEWVRERLGSGATRRPEPGRRWIVSEDAMPRVVDGMDAR